MTTKTLYKAYRSTSYWSGEVQFLATVPLRGKEPVKFERVDLLVRGDDGKERHIENCVVKSKVFTDKQTRQRRFYTRIPDHAQVPGVDYEPF